VPSAVASAAARASIAVPAGTIPPKGSAGIVAPVRAGQTLTVLNGYDNPPPNEPCPPKGYGHDHCTNQQYGLDLVPSDLDDLLVLAPVAGTIAWQDATSGCLGIVPTAFPELNLTVCHLSEVRLSGAAKAGEVLGLRRPGDPWIHMSLDVRKDANGPLPKAKWTVGVPFSGAFTIAGTDFAPAASPQFNLHACTSITSTTKATGDIAQPNPKPVVKTADLSKCGITAVKPPSPKPPSPRPALRTVDDLIAAPHPARSKAKARAAIDAAFAARPGTLSAWTYFEEGWGECVDGGGVSNPKQAQATREAMCKGIVRSMFFEYRLTGEDAFWNAAIGVWGYAISDKGIGPRYDKEIVEFLRLVCGSGPRVSCR